MMKTPLVVKRLDVEIVMSSSARSRAFRGGAGILFAVAALSFIPPLSAAQPLFRPRADYPAGNYPYAIAVADFNEDGWPDVVVTNLYVPTVSILLGGGDGTFAAPSLVNVGSEAGAVAVGDVDTDGHLDLVVTRVGAGAVAVLSGNGDGTFHPPTNYAVGVSPVDVAIADFNSDGRPDLAVVNRGTNACCWTVSVLLAISGGFAPQVQLHAKRWPVALDVRDLNGDGIPDLVVTNNGAGSVTAWLGNGDGTFGTAADFYAGSYPHSLAIGDVSGDGRPDLLVGSYPEGFNVLLGSGGGTFGAAAHFVGASTNAVTLGDLDGDGRLDIASADWDSDSVSVFLGDGAGNFGARSGFAAGNRCVSVAIADLDRDSRPDLVVTNALSNSVSVFLGQPRLTSAGPTTAPRSDLEGARPDPFVTSTQIAYRLAHDGPVRLSVFDLRGREVSVLEDGPRAAGPHVVTWYARARGGSTLPAGVYFVRLQLPEGGERAARVVRLR